MSPDGSVFVDTEFLQDYPADIPGFVRHVAPTPVQNPELVVLNNELAEELGLDVRKQTVAELAQFFVGNQPPPSCMPYALAYAGHQFGYFVHQLGDGRAVMLGQLRHRSGQLMDVQLKGAGQTPFSRNGDGRSALGPALREYVVSEAMHALNIPTTRSLAVVLTNESVFRGQVLPGAITTRVADSHLRVGTFQFFACRGQWGHVRQLADYAINRHHRDLMDRKNRYQSFFQRVIRDQAVLIAKWMGVGFIHGVMNTDNMTISGHTIDYGPCAFMDEYDVNKVFSSIDQQGRYAFGRQAEMAHWNLTRLAECLLPLFNEDHPQATEEARALLEGFSEEYVPHVHREFAAKLGFPESSKTIEELVTNLLDIMQRGELDFTQTFQYLIDQLNSREPLNVPSGLVAGVQELVSWVPSWRKQLEQSHVTAEDAHELMRAVNPYLIPRNHQLADALRQAETCGDYKAFHRLLEAYRNPFKRNEQWQDLAEAPQPDERVRATFCGT